MKFFDKHHRLSVVITILIAVFIFVMSSFSAEEIGNAVSVRIFNWETIVYHFVIFGVLCFFVCISLVQGKIKKRWLIILAVLLTIIYGATDEIHQLFVPGRFCSALDLLVDSIGAVAGGVGYWIFMTCTPARMH